MKHKTTKYRQGFTITELMMTVAMVSIVTLSVGFLLVDSQKGYNKTYNHINEGMASDAYTATTAFERAVRKSGINRQVVSTSQILVYYYNNDSSTWLDRYAKFYLSDEELLVDYGQSDADGNLLVNPDTLTLANNVEQIYFTNEDACIEMVLKLNNGSETLTAMSSAIMHNE